MFKMPFDKTSLILYFSYQALNLTITFASFDFKIIVELLGSLAGFSTVVYNGVKVVGEVRRFFDKKKEKEWPKVKKDDEEENP